MAKIQALSRKRMSKRAIARKLGVSQGSVQNALTGKAGAPKKQRERATIAKGKPPAWTRDETPVGDVNADDVRTWLAEQIRDQRAIARHAKKTGDVETFQAASRALTASSLLLARVLRQEEKRPEGMFVTSDMLDDAAQKAREKLLERVVRRAERKQ